MQRWRRKSRELVYDHKYFKLQKDIVQLPTGKEIEWLSWDSRDSAMVVGITLDKKLVMIKQYRYLHDGDSIEFPAGSSNEGESMEAAARREFEEETGYKAVDLIKLGAFYETIAQLNRQIHIYLALDAKRTNHKTACDDDEKFEILLVDLEEALKLNKENQLITMASSLALCLANNYLNENNLI